MAATVVKPKIDLIDAENGAQLWIFFSVELLVCPYQYRSHFGYSSRLKNIITFHLLYGDLTLIVGNLIILRGISMSYLPAIPIF